MKKAVIGIILIILPTTTFANQTPPICNSTPESLAEYFSNVMSIISKTKSKWSQSQPSGLKGLGKKFIQSTLGNIAILSLFGVEGIFTNFFQSFFVIFHQEYIVRDWVQLINFKKVIANYFLEGAKIGVLDENIPNLQEIKSITETNPYFLLKPTFSTYKELFSYLRINQRLIEDIYFGIVVRKKSPKEIEEKLKKHIKALKESIKNKKTKQNINLKSNISNTDSIIHKLQKTYLHNGKEFKCDKSILEMIKSIKEIVNISQKSKNTVKRFKCNYQRLKNALFGSTLNPECTNYGSVKLVKGWHIGVKGKIKVQGAGKIIIDSTKEKLFDTSKFNPDFSNLKRVFGDIKKTFSYSIITGTISNNIKTSKDNFINEVNNLISNLEESKKNIDNILLSVSPEFSHEITQKFPILSLKIRIGICTIDNKYPGCDDISESATPTAKKFINLNKNGIYQNLVEACENQSPFMGICRYLGF